MLPSLPKRARRAAAATLLALPLTAGFLAPSAGAQLVTDPTVEVTGHGWGHGRGMGQYGAYGYVSDYNWTSAQILDHFYGNTVAGQATAGSVDPDNVRIYLRSQAGVATAVGRSAGTFSLLAADGTIATNLTQPAEGEEPVTFEDMSGAIRLEIAADGYRVMSATSCGGPWTEIGTIAGLSADVVRGAGATPLHQCRDDGSVRRYEGVLRAYNHNGAARTVNITSIEEYLRGVVPSESPSYWPIAALEAQAVAARSYALAGDTRHQPYADTCDTILCQVYGGRDATNSRTDTAIANTTGLVRLRDGKIARTEFSASTGGYTVAGTFPAVEDLGDASSKNPNHNWSTTVNLSGIEERYGLGALLDIEVTERNGLGADGGRATSVVFRFEDGNRTVTGDRARQLMGLKSDWFSVGEVQRPENEVRANAAAVLHRFFVGADPDEAQTAQMVATLAGNGDNYEALAHELAQTDAWAGRMIDDLYQRALGRSADDGGRAYWLTQLRKPSVNFADVGVWFFGSEEYFLRSGGTNESFVTDLYQELLHREPDEDGFDYWVGKLNEGAGYDDIAFGFWLSLESRLDRAEVVSRQVLERAPDNGERERWADWLIEIGDTGLTARLAASDEFMIRHG